MRRSLAAALFVFYALEASAYADDVEYDKGFVLTDANGQGDFESRLQLRIESLWEMTSADDTTDAKFTIARARIQLEGHAFTPKLRYKFQADFGKSSVSLKDFWFEAEVASKVWVRSGQWKRPFSRQQITSSGKLEMTTRSITDKAFLGGRDIGVALHDQYEGSPDGLEWVLGVFDGTGVDMGPPAWMPAFAARIGWNHGGIKGYSEADLEGGPLRWAVGASVVAETDFDRDSSRTHRAEVDAIWKDRGASVSGAVYGLTRDGIGQLGGHIQGGAMLGTGLHRYEPVMRYGCVAPEDASASHEVMLGVGWFPRGHNLKVLLDAGRRTGPDEWVVQVGFDAGMF